MKYKTRPNVGTIVSCVMTAAVAIAAIVAVVLLINPSSQGEDNSSAQLEASRVQALLDECGEAANQLVKDNYTILKLFVTEGLSFKTVYGNPAEDGYHSVDDEVYKHYSQIEDLVKSVYVEEEAERILTRFPIKVENGTKNVQVYIEHKDPSDGEMCLGINEEFNPDTDYSRDWSRCMINVHPENDTECTLKVILDGYSEEEASAHLESVITAQMIKTDGVWRLDSMLK